MHSTKSMGHAVGITVGTLLLMVSYSTVVGMYEMKCRGEKMNMLAYAKGFLQCAPKYMKKEDIDTFKSPSATAEQRKAVQKTVHDNVCIRVCQWKKHQHVLNEDGTANEEKTGDMIDKSFPKDVREEVKTGFKKCHADHSKDFDDKDNCKGYKPFSTCLQDVFKKACKIDKFPFE